MAVLDPGDEAVIPAPYWVSYPDMVLLADGLPVTPICPASQGYKLMPRQLEAAITPKTRLLLINSPCNPTGAAYTRAEWRALADVLLKHPRVIVGTDDMYEKIWWGPEPFSSLLTVAPELYDRVVTINGVSKSYAMTGWRLGYCGGPKEIVNAMSTLQGQSTSNACSITQKAALAALTGDQKPVEAMNLEFKRRHDWFIAALNRLPGIVALPCAGAFYAWADCSAAMAAFGIRDDNAFAEMLINDAGVAVVPGSGFGAPGHFRASFATSMAVLEKSIERMQKVLEAGPVKKSA
jgi:aspartate aminotransferase